MQYQKIAPELMSVYVDYDESGEDGIQRHIKTLGVVSKLDSPKPPRSVVFIHCQANADFSHLRADRIYVNQSHGEIRTAILPIESLSRLTEEKTVDYVVPGRYLQPQMQIAGAKTALATYKQNSGLNGCDTIIGIVDTGIDPRHPDFDGRILSVWDQTASGDGVNEGQYGREVKGERLIESRDENGHGTHVAGIAAGAGEVYRGVAEKANLVVVKTSFNDAHIADGIRYVFRIAEELGRPAVVNLSLGGHSGPHDGTGSLSQLIDDVSGPGKIVCCAAGNEGNDNIHAQLRMTPGQSGKVRFFVPRETGVAVINGWYSGKDRLAVAVGSPNGLQTPFQEIISTGKYSHTYKMSISDDRTVFVRISTPPANLFNHDHNFFIEVFSPSRFPMPLPHGGWYLIIEGREVTEGQVDLWTLDNNRRQDVIFSGNEVQDRVKIGSPGSSARAITVAAYTTSIEWRDVDQQDRKLNMPVDNIAEFSSEGPLRNGARKPDLAAPGAMIISCFSSDSSAPRAKWISSNYRVMAGTSMACPFVSGVVALLLQRNPQLTPEQAKQWLIEHCRIPRQASGTFDCQWGYGVLNFGGPDPAL